MLQNHAVTFCFVFLFAIIVMIPHICYFFSTRKITFICCVFNVHFVHFKFTHLYPLFGSLTLKEGLSLHLAYTLNFFNAHKMCAVLFTFGGLFAFRLNRKDQKYFILTYFSLSIHLNCIV